LGDGNLLFIILLFAHLIGDFIFQSNHIAASKSGFNRAMRIHIAVHTAVLSVCLGLYLLYDSSKIAIYQSLLLLILIPFFHFLVDITKVRVDHVLKKRQRYAGAFTYVADQALHLFVILVLLYEPLKKITLKEVEITLEQLIKGQTIAITPFGRLLALAILVILITRFSGFLVGSLAGPEPRKDFVVTDRKVVLTTTYPPQPSLGTAKSEVVYMHMDDPDPPRGMLIGYLERLIIMWLVFGQAYSAIAFIAAAKSLVRFKQMDHREWAEYFLVGTLSSMLLALAAGHVLMSIL
jgi:hypothetical protein